MGEGYNFQKLKQEILALSEAEDWEVAKKEWRLVDVSEADEPETCLCGHFPIIELCSIHNRLTGAVATVGNACVKRFLGIRSDSIFTALKRIRKDIHKSLNADAILFFYENGVLTSWELDFSQNTMRRRNLSEKQLEKRERINRKVLAAVQKAVH